MNAGSQSSLLFTPDEGSELPHKPPSFRRRETTMSRARAANSAIKNLSSVVRFLPMNLHVDNSAVAV